MPLSKEELAEFQEQGYFLKKGLIDQSTIALMSKEADGLQPHKDFESDSFTIGLEGDLEAYSGIVIEMDPGDTGGADSPNDIFSNDSLYPTQLEETCLKQD